MWKRQIRAEEVERNAQALSDRAKTLREQRPGSREGLTTEENSENEDAGPGAVVRYKNSSTIASTVAGRALGRAAEGLRGAADMFRGTPGDEGESGKPAGHPV